MTWTLLLQLLLCSMAISAIWAVLDVNPIKAIRNTMYRRTLLLLGFVVTGPTIALIFALGFAFILYHEGLAMAVAATRTEVEEYGYAIRSTWRGR